MAQPYLRLVRITAALAALLVCLGTACADSTAPHGATQILTGNWALVDEDVGVFSGQFALKDTTLSAGSMQDTVSRWMGVFLGQDTVAVDAIAVGKGAITLKGVSGPASCVAMTFHSWPRGSADDETTERLYRFRLQCSGTITGRSYGFDTNCILGTAPPSPLAQTRQMYIPTDGWGVGYSGLIVILKRTP